MKRALVTGSSGGIGSAVLRTLADRGVACIGLDVSAPAHAVPDATYHQCDLADAKQLSETLDEIAKANPDGIDYLVHCAAIVQFSRMCDTPASVWDRVIDVNLKATITLAATLLPHIRNEGRIIFFGSGTVFKGPKEMFAYVASKAGVIGFAKCLAEEVGDRSICVNVIAPGLTQTPMMQGFKHIEAANIATRAIKRAAVVDDIVGPIMFLLSDEARFVTGQTICVDGGSVRH